MQNVPNPNWDETLNDLDLEELKKTAEEANFVWSTLISPNLSQADLLDKDMLGKFGFVGEGLSEFLARVQSGYQDTIVVGFPDRLREVIAEAIIEDDPDRIYYSYNQFDGSVQVHGPVFNMYAVSNQASSDWENNIPRRLSDDIKGYVESDPERPHKYSYFINVKLVTPEGERESWTFNIVAGQLQSQGILYISKIVESQYYEEGEIPEVAISIDL